MKKDASGDELVNWAREAQQEAGALFLPPAPPPGTIVNRFSSDTIRSYMRRLEDAYAEMNAAVTDVMANRPPQAKAAWVFINAWHQLFSRWEAFYWGSINDFIMADSTYAEAQAYSAELESTRKGYKKALGEAPPGAPKLPKEETPSSTLDSAVTLAKWGVIAYVVVMVGKAVSDKRGEK